MQTPALRRSPASFASQRRAAGRVWRTGALALVLGLAAGGVCWAQTATYNVTNNADSGAGSLRQAVTNATGVSGAAINFNNNLGTITLGSNLPSFNRTTTLNVGTGNTIDGGNNYNGLSVAAFTTTLNSGAITINSANASLIVNGGGNAAVFALANDASLIAGTNEFIGTDTTGTFTQSGTSTHTVGAQLFIGFPGFSSTTTTGNGTYNLNGGTLNTGFTQLGNYGTGGFNQNGGAHNVSQALLLGLNGGSGTYAMSSGSLTTDREFVGYTANGGTAGFGRFTQSGGTHTVKGNLLIGNDTNTTGIYNLSAGQLTTGGTYVGNTGSGTFTQSGGTHTITGSDPSNNQLYIAVNANSAGTYNMQGGTLTAPSLDVGDSGAGTFTQSGGTVNVATSLDIGFYSGGSGTYTLGTGGTLQVSGYVSGNTGTSTFNFAGGTLQAGADNASFVRNITFANVQSGGTVIDTNGRAVTIPQLLAHDRTNGAAATDGGLTKNGAGTLTLTAANTYTGSTNVNAGSLLVNNTSGSGTGSGVVAVNNSGTRLGGTGTISGEVTVANSGAIIRGGDGASATGALTLRSNFSTVTGSIIELALGGSGAHSSLIRTGSGFWSFTNNQTFSFLNFGAQPGMYNNIISGLANDPGNENTWVIANPGFSGSFIYDNAGGIDLMLVAVPEPATWLGGGATALLAGYAFWRRRPHRTA